GHVRLVVGFAAGGASSMQAGRIVGSASFGGIGQSIVTVRKVGTGGGGAGQQEQGGKHRPHRPPRETGAAGVGQVTAQGWLQGQPSSFCLSSWFTCCGLALPLDAFIAWPTKKPPILPRLASSLARYCSTWAALAASTSSSMASMAPVSVTCLSPRASMIWSASSSPLAMASNTILAILPEMVLSLMRRIMPPSCSALTGDWSISISDLFSRLDNSPITQLAASLASPQVRWTCSK